MSIKPKVIDIYQDWFYDINENFNKVGWLVGWLVGLVLWHTNPCWLFDAKSCIYISIKNTWFVIDSLLVTILKLARVHLFAHSEKVSSIAI